MRFDPGHQFARTEGLGHVVVAADLEAENAIDFIGPRGQENDRRAREFPGLANLPAKIEAVLPRKHHVQNDEIRLPGFELAQRLPRPVQHFHLEAAAGQIVLDQRSQFGFILNDRYFPRHAPQATSASPALRTGADLAKVVVRVYPGIVPVAPDNTQRVVADGFDRRPFFLWAYTSGTGWRALPAAVRLGPRLGAMRAGAGGAGAPVAQILHAVTSCDGRLSNRSRYLSISKSRYVRGRLTEWS